MKIVFYLSREELEDLNRALNVLMKIRESIGGYYTPITLDVDQSIFHLRNLLEKLRKYMGG